MLNDIINIWEGGLIKIRSASENLNNFSCAYNVSDITKCDLLELKKILYLNVNFQDVFTVKVSISGNACFEFSPKTKADVFDGRINDFLSEKEEFELSGDEVFECILEINVYKKSIKKDRILISNVYSVDKFSAYISSIGIYALNEEFFKSYYSGDVLRVVFRGNFSTTYSTSFFVFSPRDFDCENLDCKERDFERSELVKIRNRSGHFSNASNWPFLPDDFNFSGEFFEADFFDIYQAFEKLKTVYLICFLANIASVSLGFLEYFVNGFVDLNKKHYFSEISNFKSTMLWDLYKWAYDGRTNEKLGLIRDIVSKYSDGFFDVNEATIISVNASFNLLQRDNVKDYIDVTNKLSEKILSISDKADDVVDKVASSMKSGFWGVTSFTVSVILFRLFSKGSELKSFNELLEFISSPICIFVFSISLLIFSVMFLVAYSDSFSEHQRFKDMYASYRKIYENVLTKSDMDKILSNDSWFKSSNKFINKKRHKYFLIWFFSFLFSSVSLFLLSCL